MNRAGPLFCAVLLPAALVGPSSAAEITLQAVNEARFQGEEVNRPGQSPLVLKAQILLDRSNASPGVIDGYYGGNVAKAISAFEAVHGLPEDGELDPEVWSALGGDRAEPMLIEYEVTEQDLAEDFLGEIPEDYAELAKLERIGFSNPEEMFAERFHMDIDLLTQLNGDSEITAGTKLIVANVEASPPQGKVARIEADKARAQLRAYDTSGKLLVAYPATIGSEQTPSPSGTHKVNAVAQQPVYYYRPEENFQQGENTKPLDIPPGPNNPVGSVWIDLSEPTYGIHGTPEPSEIDKTASHGCVRLTNWDAEELAGLVEPGVEVRFLE